jgi:hypothetical protein
MAMAAGRDLVAGGGQCNAAMPVGGGDMGMS